MRLIHVLTAPKFPLPQPEENYGRDDQNMGKRTQHASQNRCREWANYFGTHLGTAEELYMILNFND